ncbi:hypothetical protein VD0002_g3576 [Verticillium dahliae]|uniref:Peroxidase n=2 Tax=Verticillium dahliae TaxID=27337 RepID=G2XJS3_VERDV|nr:ligninase H2 [Verticillium dahliae VdLs.17]KAF3351660.1 hypothetical protein VdG2_00184 [Verticillium dahliae VDG2]KAF3357725.1 hypothetical protein VdG1_05700 [Verticillium dahliae VDG1]KAH6708067.1 ligninase H2 [Verticillium dahliae]EGY20776.1 ligninase H2 [Verticillium dahliae VdLs.17]PNH27050.1 hypothetical protein BJF96_g9648 [Verticillium dahliae]
MHLPTILTTTVALASVPGVLGHPGMGKALGEIMSRQADEGDSTELLGDLVTLKDKDLTNVGKDIKKLLTGKGNPESNEKYTKVPPKNSAACKADTCCIWSYIAKDMYGFMAGQSGRCTKWARFAVRMGFHDAAGWSKSTASEGNGADGSIILSNSELDRSENNGLQEMGARFQQMYDNYRGQGWDIGMADLIQMGANVATVTCPLGPRIKTYVGRKDSATPAPENLLPDVNADADSLIALFRDKTIGPHGLVALVGAHTTSQQMFVNESRAGDPQDSTPGVWDVKFYPETTGKAPARVFRFPSDIKLSQHPTTKKEWKEFSGGGGQNHWNEDYAREYIRLSLLGVNNINKLTECTKVLPPTTKKFSPSDQRKVEKWLNNTDRKGKAAKIAENLLAGDLVVDDVPATASPTAPATVTPAA